jgi:amino acid efflux transporter
MHTYIAGGARLGTALARDGALPAALARGRRSLALLAIATAALTAVVLPTDLGLDPLMRVTAACLAAVTLIGTASATRLLTGRARTLARAGTLFTGVVLLSCGLYLAVPAALALTVLGLRLGHTTNPAEAPAAPWRGQLEREAR